MTVIYQEILGDDDQTIEMIKRIEGDEVLFVPIAEGNRHYEEYRNFLADGGVPVKQEKKTLADLKAEKNEEINQARAAANASFFTFQDKRIACDALSRSDIDGVMGHIALNNDLPIGFPGVWKSMDNELVPVPDVAAFKSMYSAMTEQGTANFMKSQQLKGQLEAATTKTQVKAIKW